MENHFMGKQFFASLASLVSGNAAAQLIQLLGMMFFATLYSPYAFGVLGTSQSIAVIVAALLTLQLHLMVPLAETAERACRLVMDARLIAVAVFVALFPPAMFFGGHYPVIVVLALVVALNNIHCGLMVYRAQFHRVSIFYVLRALLIVSFQFLLSKGFPEEGLLWGSLAGECVSSIVLMSMARVEGRVLPAYNLFKALWQRKAFTLYGTLQELLTIAAYYMPLYLFELRFGASISGQYAFASRLIWGPLIVVTASLSQVLLKHFAGEAGRLSFLNVHRLTLKLLLPIIVLALLAAVLGEKISLYFLGEDWRVASQMLGLSILWGAMFLVSMPYRVLLRVRGLQKFQLMVDLGVMASYGVLYLLLGKSPVGMMVGIVVVGGLQNLLLSGIVLKINSAR